jgi:hypothetical protein
LAIFIFENGPKNAKNRLQRPFHRHPRALLGLVGTEKCKISVIFEYENALFLT